MRNKRKNIENVYILIRINMPAIKNSRWSTWNPKENKLDRPTPKTKIGKATYRMKKK